MSESPKNTELSREIGFLSATIIVVANMIGTGIFTTSGFIIKELHNPLTMLLCWLVGGLFALSGALCYGELGAKYPEAGGEYAYLREGFGQLMGFLSGWISLIVGFSAPIAAAAIAFATYLFQAISLPVGPSITLPICGVHIITLSHLSLVAIGTIIMLSFVHYYSVTVGSRVQNVLTLLKIGIILIFVTTGLSLGRGSTSHFSQGLPISTVFEDRFAIALVFVSFAYSGWNGATYLGAEIRRPGRNIPLALVVGTFLVTGLYLLLNALYIYALPAEEMSGVLDIGAKSAIALFGGHISRYFSAGIALALLSVLSAMIMAGPRVYYAMSKDGVLFELFGRIDKAHKTPAYSICLQAAIAVVMVVTASFDRLLLYIGFTLSIFAVLTVISLIRLRVTQLAPGRGYKTFGYPVTPVLFILGNLWIIYFSIKSRPVPSSSGLVTVGLGVLAYYYFLRMKQRKKRRCF